MSGGTRLTGSAQTAADLAGRSPGVLSKEARTAARNLLDAPPDVRRAVMANLTDRDRRFIFAETLRETGTLYGLWHDTPYGFVEDVIGETMWGLQREAMDAVAIPHVYRVAVPAGFGVGKTFLAGRLTAWAGAVNPVGTIIVVTTATRLRQVRNQLWPHIKTAVAKGGLPGETNTLQWVAPDMYGNRVRIAYGFSASPNDEAAMQGIHGTPKLLLIVDEAGGIAPLIGKGTNNLLTGDAKLLAIGNPAMDDPGSWFETLTQRGEDPDRRDTITIRIASLDSPAITGEPTPICRACVPNLDGHTISDGAKSHLPDRDWLHETFLDYGVPAGRDAPLPELLALTKNDGLHPYIIAKVFALFPQDAGNKVIPASWVEGARQVEEPPADDDYVALNSLGLEHEHDPWVVRRGAWIRLGVDVAADGGDEFTIYRVVGDMVTQRHASSGKGNADSMVVSERILEEIDQAYDLAAAIDSEHQVRVKVDTIGLGWGVVGNLRRWASTGRHKALIVPVNVAERPEREDESSSMRPLNKRAEMWLAGRSLLQPDPSTGVGRLRLRIDGRAAAQLSTPNQGANSAGLVTIETKASMKARGAHSPDRAEGLLLGVYEPGGATTSRRRGLIQG